jgi:NADPH:quinone reductase-like Zn-dependent oxidoreductase
LDSQSRSPHVLEVRDVPDPQPRAGEMRVRVEASGANFADMMARLGINPDLPAMPVIVGYEVGGRVDAVGAGVLGVNSGHLWHDVPCVRRWKEALLEEYALGTIRPVIAARFPRERAADAHHYVQDGRNLGKVLLTAA